MNWQRVLSFELTYHRPSTYEGLARVTKDGKNWEYIDRSGQQAISSYFIVASDFKGDLAIVQMNSLFVCRNSTEDL